MNCVYRLSSNKNGLLGYYSDLTKVREEIEESFPATGTSDIIKTMENVYTVGIDWIAVSYGAKKEELEIESIHIK